MEKDSHSKYINNDPEEALRLSIDTDVINRNHIQVDYSSIEYEVKASQEVRLKDMIFLNEDIIQIRISYPFNLNLKLSKIIRKQLNISLNELSYMIEEGIFTISNVENWKRDKIKDNTVVEINKEKLCFYILHPDRSI